jgi:5-formyltetrahydrofolate cyclo-ligase
LTLENPPPPGSRAHWRQALLARRDAFAHHPDFSSAQSALVACLQPLLVQLAPQCLGLYWPIRGEFNAASLWEPAQTGPEPFPCALPFAQRDPVQMHYRHWDGRPPAARDACGIPCSDGAPVVPDVVLVPCVGFTRGGHRLGFGAGYYDRWLAAHPHVTAIGVAWSFSELPPDAWTAEPHDQPLMLIVTEHGVVA